MIWWQWLASGTLYVVIGAALAAGMAASYGRELEARRRPDRHWWVRRLLVMPVLAIVAATAADLFNLKPSMAAFSAAMLSLGGYDLLCLIEVKWLRRIESIAIAAAGVESQAPATAAEPGSDTPIV